MAKDQQNQNNNQKPETTRHDTLEEIRGREYYQELGHKSHHNHYPTMPVIQQTPVESPPASQPGASGNSGADNPPSK